MRFVLSILGFSFCLLLPFVLFRNKAVKVKRGRHLRKTSLLVASVFPWISKTKAKSHTVVLNQDTPIKYYPRFFFQWSFISLYRASDSASFHF